jgi:putative ABC transport system permease protein
VAIPLSYSFRSLRARWTVALVAVIGVAACVTVAVAVLSLAYGFRSTLVTSGSAENVIVRRAGAIAEADSQLTLAQTRIIDAAPGVAQGPTGAIASPEVVLIGSVPLAGADADAYVQLRGVTPKALELRKVRLTSGRALRPGLHELIVGRYVGAIYQGFELGAAVNFAGSAWTVVGVFDAGGSSFDSEVWGDATLLSQAFQQGNEVFQSMTVRLTSPEALRDFTAALMSDRRLTVQVEPEVAYYERQSRRLTRVLAVVGSLIGLVMGIGAVFAALNTMYSMVAERIREVAVMRSLGFPAGSVVTAFTIEAVCIALIGGIAGILAVLPLDGVTTGAMNWQTSSYLAFSFRLTPELLGGGIGFALAMGLIGGVPPALRAARAPIAIGLREL